MHPSEEVQPLRLSAVVFDLSSLASVDASALAIFLEIIESYHQQQITVVLVRIRRKIKTLFEKAGILSLVGKDNMFRSLEAAVQAVQLANLSGLKSSAEELGFVHVDEEGETNEAMDAPAGAVVIEENEDEMNATSDIAESVASKPSDAPNPPLLRRKKSLFHQPPVVASPLLRQLTRMKMTS